MKKLSYKVHKIKFIYLFGLIWQGVTMYVVALTGLELAV